MGAESNEIALDQPQGGFAWSDALRKQLPVVRGVRTIALPAAVHTASAPPGFADDPFWHEWIGEVWSELAAAGAELRGKPWSQTELTRRLHVEQLSRNDLNGWREIVYQCAVHGNYSQQRHLYWAFDSARTLQGLPFAVELLIRCSEVTSVRFLNGWHLEHTPSRQLRIAIAAAADTDHAASLAIAGSLRGHSIERDCLISHLFPEQADWAEQCVARNPSAEQAWWLNECMMSVETACAHFHRRPICASHALPAALLQLHLHDAAALPLLTQLLDQSATKEDTRQVLRIMERLAAPELIPALIARSDQPEVRVALDQLATRWPAATLRAAVARLSAQRSGLLESWAIRLALGAPAAVEPALAACSETERERFHTLLAQRAHPDEAPESAVPEILCQPPWTRKQPVEPLPVLTLAAPRIADRLDLSETADPPREPTSLQWIDQRFEAERELDRKLTLERFILGMLAVRTSAYDALLAGEPLRAEDIVEQSWYYLDPALLTRLPEPVAVAIWNGMPTRHWSTWAVAEAAATLLHRFGLQLRPGLVNVVSAYPEQGFDIAQPCFSVELVPLAAHVLKNTKKARNKAAAWLRRHAEDALRVLLPPAFGKDRVPAENARFALHWLARNGFDGELRRIAGEHGAAVSSAVEHLLSVDAELLVPTRMPKLPAFFVPAALHRPLLRSGGALPPTAVTHLGRMLSISTLETPYGGLDSVRTACTPDSLAEFAWSLFEAWLSAAAPSKASWAFTALGLLGDDETARRLTPRIRAWPGESAHARAVTGLDILAAIGTDVALMHLNSIADKVRFKGLQKQARERIARVAAARELTTMELADRLVPDLDLDADGGLVLDFGPRRFHLTFDEALKPFVRDATGARLKNLPKPGRSDDPILAKAAGERYKALKKDARAIASQQIVRFEQAMCLRRRWSTALFRRFFIDHPLMRHLTRRVVWGVYRDGRLAEAFRVAEDLTLANRHDDHYTLDDEASVGIAHALDMPADLAAEFGQIFADYEILQPFRQLGRETHAPTDEERRTGVITRFKDKKVATTSILGLTQRGWERGEAQDAGWVGWFLKPLPDELDVELWLDPGTIVGDPSFEPEQVIPSIAVRRRGTWDDSGKVNIATLDPVMVSEIIRDVDLLAPL